jgi:hypothetical protein
MQTKRPIRIAKKSFILWFYSFLFVLFAFFLIPFFIEKRIEFQLRSLSKNYLLFFQGNLEHLSKSSQELERNRVNRQFFGDLTQLSFKASSTREIAQFFSLLQIPYLDKDLSIHGTKVSLKKYLIGFYIPTAHLFILSDKRLLASFENRYLLNPFFQHLFLNHFSNVSMKRFPNFFTDPLVRHQFKLFLVYHDTLSSSDHLSFLSPQNREERNLIKVSKALSKVSLEEAVQEVSMVGDLYRGGVLFYQPLLEESFIIAIKPVGLLNALFINIKATFFTYFIIFLVYFSIGFFLYQKLQKSLLSNKQKNPKIFKPPRNSNEDERPIPLEIAVSQQKEGLEANTCTIPEQVSSIPMAFKDFDSEQQIKLEQQMEHLLSFCDEEIVGSHFISNYFHPPLFFFNKEKRYKLYNSLMGQKKIVNDTKDSFIFFYHLLLDAKEIDTVNQCALFLAAKLVSYMKGSFVSKTDDFNLEYYAEGILYGIQKDFLENCESLKDSLQINGYLAVGSLQTRDIFYFTLGDENKLHVVGFNSHYKLDERKDLYDFSTNSYKPIKLDDFFNCFYPLHRKNLPFNEDVYWSLLQPQEEAFFVNSIKKSAGYFKGVCIEYQSVKGYDNQRIGFHHIKFLNSPSLYLELKKENKEKYKKKADDAFHKENYEKALEQYQKAFEELPCEEILMDIYQSYYLIGNDEGKARALDKALKWNPYYEDFLLQATIYYKEKKEYKKSLYFALRLFLIAPYNEVNIVHIASLKELLGLFKDADNIKKQL